MAKLQISKRDPQADRKVIKSQENHQYKQHRGSYRQLQEAVVQLRVAGLPLNNLDSFQLEEKVSENPTKKGLRVSLNGSNYVSEKTKAAFEDALRDGHQVNSKVEKSKVSKKLVPKGNNMGQLSPKTETVGQNNDFKQGYSNSQKQITDNDTIKEQIKISMAKNSSNSSQQNSLDGIDANIMRFQEYQAEVVRTHEKFLQYQAEYTQQFFQLMQQKRMRLPSGKITTNSITSIPETSSITEKVKVSSDMAVTSPTIEPIQDRPQTGEVTKASQNRVFAAIITPTIEPVSVPIRKPDVEGNGVQVETIPQRQPTFQTNASDGTSATVPIPQTKTEVTAEPETGVVSKLELESLTKSLLEVVSDKTGYPAEMLELEMDLEADLGIDSIKRVEIMGAMQELFPDLPPVNPEELAELRTLAQIVGYMGNRTSSQITVAQPAPVAATEEKFHPQPEQIEPIARQNGTIPQPELESLTKSLVEVVSNKTGYPAEMLELEMDLEADLGIDSIKRVEIMGAMQELFPDLPPVNPEELAELQTLAQIVGYMNKQSGEAEKKTSIAV